jgi:hydroxyacyl-ACP dehydratase HTD2-like protein with hotdog domain
VPDLVAVHARLLELVGTSGPEISGRADRRDFARFALACRDEDPGDVAPPLFLPATIEWGTGSPLHELREDGTGAARDAFLPLDGLRLMGGGQELELGEDIVHGTQFTARPTLEDVALRDGRSGPLLILRLRTEFRATDGRLLVTSRETILAREPAA